MDTKWPKRTGGIILPPLRVPVLHMPFVGVKGKIGILLLAISSDSVPSVTMSTVNSSIISTNKIR